MSWNDVGLVIAIIVMYIVFLQFVALSIMVVRLMLGLPARPTPRAPDASPDTCEHGFMRGNCYVEVCEFSKYGERR
jgi:hypothetical protein